MNLTMQFLVVAGLASFIVGLSKGGLPMIGILSVPLMALVISPIAAAGLLLPIYVISDMFGLWFYRRDYSLTNLKILVPATTIGVGVGWAAASITSERLVTLVIGIIGLAYCANALIKRRGGTVPARPADVGRGYFWGIIAGFTSFVSHSGGPPYQMYVLPQRLEKMVFAGTSTILFAYVNAIKLVPYYLLGQLGTSDWTLALILAAVAVLGTFTGVQLVKVLPQKIFFAAVETALFMVSVKLVYDAL
jgi:uncharacterized membrane protein YfcA